MSSKTPFTPQFGDTYYSLYKQGANYYTRRHQWDNHQFDNIQLETGNCYATEADALAAIPAGKHVCVCDNTASCTHCVPVDKDLVASYELHGEYPQEDVEVPVVNYGTYGEALRPAPSYKPKIYICGAITDAVNGGLLPDYKAKFNKAARLVEACGYTAVNPTTLPHKHGHTWAEFMREDIKALMDCDAVYALNDFGASRGARIEVDLANNLGMPILFYKDFVNGNHAELLGTAVKSNAEINKAAAKITII